MQTTGQGEGSIQRQRVYEVAKDMGLANKDLVDKIRALGIEVKNHMSALDPEDVNRVKRALEKERMENTVVERIQPTVIRRRNKHLPAEAVPPPRPTPTPITRKPGRDESKATEETALPLRRPRPQGVPVDAEPEVEAAEVVEERAEVAPAPSPEPNAAHVEMRAVEPVTDEQAPPAPPAVEAAPPPPAPEAPRAAPPRREARHAPPVVVQAEPPPPPPTAPHDGHDRTTTQSAAAPGRAREAPKPKDPPPAAQKAAAEPPPQPAPSPGRPAVGSIIELPLTRIQITERGPGGKPLSPGQ